MRIVIKFLENVFWAGGLCLLNKLMLCYVGFVKQINK